MISAVVPPCKFLGVPAAPSQTVLRLDTRPKSLQPAKSIKKTTLRVDAVDRVSTMTCPAFGPSILVGNWLPTCSIDRAAGEIHPPLDNGSFFPKKGPPSGDCGQNSARASHA